MPQKLIGILGSHPAIALLAKACAQNGFFVLLVDDNRSALENSIQKIRNSFDDDPNLSIHGLSPKDECLSRIQLSLDIKALDEASFLFCGSLSDLKILHGFKKNIPIGFLDGDLSPTEGASGFEIAERFAGLFPVVYEKQIRLVEIIRAVKTSDQTLKAFEDLFVNLKTETIRIHDFTGPIFERITYAAINEAIQVLYEGIAPAESIDRVMILGLSHPVGPLKLADMLGLDRVKRRLEYLFKVTANPKFLPSPLLNKLTEAGFTGIKAGRGFYQYK